MSSESGKSGRSSGAGGCSGGGWAGAAAAAARCGSTAFRSMRAVLLFSSSHMKLGAFPLLLLNSMRSEKSSSAMGSGSGLAGRRRGRGRNPLPRDPEDVDGRESRSRPSSEEGGAKGPAIPLAPRAWTGSFEGPGKLPGGEPLLPLSLPPPRPAAAARAAAAATAWLRAVVMEGEMMLALRPM